MVYLSTKTLLFSAVLLALSLDGIYAADDKPKCKAVDTPCGGSRSPCCDGLECLGYSYMDMPDGVCRPAKPAEGNTPPPSDEPPKDTPTEGGSSGDGGKKDCLLLGIDLGPLCL